MRRAPFRQVYVLMLGLLVALGMSLSVVQASDMAVKMAMSAHPMSASDMSDCSSCKDGHGGVQTTACDAACAMAMNATVPQLVVLLIQIPADRIASEAVALSGWLASPNPHPPKHSTIV